MHLDQRVHAKAQRGILYLAHEAVIQRGDDDQDGVRAQCPAFQHLPGIDHEILTQHWKHAGGASGDKIGVCALEIGFVGQDGQTSRATGRIGGGMSRRIEVGADQSLGRAGLLDLRDEAEA